MSRGATATSLDEAALARWLQEAAPEVQLPVRTRLIAGGRSNLTFELTDRLGTRFCLRRPPFGSILASAHDVVREHRILDALQPTSVPVPRTVAVCEDPDVLGADFYLMAFVDGLILHRPSDAAVLDAEARARLAGPLTDTLWRIHALDVDEAGLGDLSRRGDYVRRQLRRWRRQLESAPHDQAAPLLELADALEQSAPDEQVTVLVHGDYKLANLVLGPDGAVRAVLDWELSTLGDPLADLGWLLASWAQPDSHRPRIVPPPTRAGGFPTPEELVAAYATASGLDVSQAFFYEAFSHWKWACIDVGIHTRFSRGVMGTSSVDLDLVTAEITSRTEQAWQLLERTSPPDIDRRI